MSEGIELGSAHRREQVSVPDLRDRHLISDEELTLIANPLEDRLSKLWWAAVGIVGGAVPSGGGAVSSAWHGAQVGGNDLFGLCVLLAGLVVMAVCLILRGREPSPREKLVAEIRARPRVPLRTIADLDYRD